MAGAINNGIWTKACGLSNLGAQQILKYLPSGCPCTGLWNVVINGTFNSSAGCPF
jgi:hypothetical protein